MMAEPHRDIPLQHIKFFSNETNSYSVLNIYCALGTTLLIGSSQQPPKVGIVVSILRYGNRNSERGTLSNWSPCSE